MPPLFDILRQPETLTPRDLANLVHFGVRAAAVPLGAGPDAEALANGLAKRCRRADLAPALTFAPDGDRLPGGALEVELQRLPRLLSLPRACGLGPVGLGPPGSAQGYLLSRLLALANELRQPIVVRCASPEVRLARRLLAIIRESEIAPELVLLTGLPPAALRLGREVGHAIALSLSPSFGPKRLVETVNRFGSERVLVLGEGADLLSLPKAESLLGEAQVPSLVIRRLVYDNGWRLFACGWS